MCATPLFRSWLRDGRGARKAPFSVVCFARRLRHQLPDCILMTRSSDCLPMTQTSASPKIEWVKGVYFKEKYAKSNGSRYFFMVGITDNMERRKIYVDARHEDMILHFKYAIEGGKDNSIPIEPKLGMDNGFQVVLQEVDSKPPVRNASANPINKMLIRQAMNDSSSSIASVCPVKQSFKLTYDTLQKVQALTAKKNIRKSELYAKAVAHFVELDGLADSIGV
jgi:hypothetical protein